MSYQSPGVYIEEVPSGPQPIAAASTSVVAILGTTRRGPVNTPTRVVGWSDYVRTFGSASARGYAAESAFGFFENGGPAAWVVRVDPSVPATWTVRDSDDPPRDSFIATAASPGAWAESISLAVAPDFSGGQGTMAHAIVAAPTSVAAGVATIPVTGGGGLAAGDSVLLTSRTATSAATVTAVAADTVSVNNTGAAIVLAAGDVIALTTAAAPSSLTFAAGSGFKVGDVLALQAPDGSRSEGTVTSVAQTGSATTLTLAAPLSGAVVAAAYAPRRATFTGTTTGSVGGTLPLSRLTWDAGADLGPRNAASQLAAARLTLPDGAIATWGTNTFTVVGGGDVPAGPVSAQAQVRVATYTVATSFTPTGVADVLTRFSALPVGTTLSLTDGTDTVSVERTAAGVGDGDGTASGTFGPTFTSAAFVLPDDASLGVMVRCAVAPRTGEYVQFAAAKTIQITGVDEIGGDAYVLSFAETTDLTGETGGDGGRFALVAVAASAAYPHRFSLTIADGGTTAETFTGLSLHPDHPQYYCRDDVVNGVSAYVRLVARAAPAPPITAAAMPASAARSQSGVDLPATNADYARALQALEAIPEPAMVIAPDLVTLTDPLLQADLAGRVITHCESFRRFAIIDIPDSDDATELLSWRNGAVSSSFAAAYAPHLQMVTIDPDSANRFTMVPPSGFVAGVFARTDRERGVHKAPGNERVRGVVGLSQPFTQRHQDLLNPGSVNLIRAFPGRGVRVWGARNATDDVTWRYVNVRRLFLMIENSVERSTQWVVFEPNTASTWIRIKVSIENFLDQQWRAGALAGTTPEQAYRVRVGLGETMTETDVDLGLVITEVAIAPAKPAEFVVFRFSHKRLAE